MRTQNMQSNEQCMTLTYKHYINNHQMFGEDHLIDKKNTSEFFIRSYNEHFQYQNTT
jgi:hypothetical protein